MTNLLAAEDVAELDLVIRASPTPLLIVDTDGTILRANEHLCSLFHYTRAELEGQTVEQLVPASTRGHHDELRDAFHHLPTKRSMGKGRDLYGQRSDGELIPVEIGLDPQQRGSQKWVFVSVIDIRERVAAANRLSLALDAVSNGVIMLEKDGEIVLVNQVACDLFGYTREQLLGQCIDLLVPERYRRKHPVFRSSYSIVNQPRRMGAGRALFALRADGTEFPVEIGLTPIHSPDGLLIMSTVMDLTKSQRQSAIMKERSDKLSMLNAELTQFAYSTSHDLKAPLSSVAGLMSIALEDLEGGDTAEVKANLKKALNLSSDLSARIEALLSIARAEDAVGEMTDVDLNQLITASAHVLKPKEDMGPIVDLDLRFKGKICSSPTMLTSIFDNLIGNAIKFADLEKEEQRVVVTSTSQEDECVISVRDNGVGIPEGRHGDVFKMFKRFSGTTKGSGLGLALVLKYVTLLGGVITFESSAAGTTFLVRLPCTKENLS